LLLLELLKDDRFWVKLCSFDKISGIPQAHVEGKLPFLDTVPFAQAVIAAAPERVIWGTDWPHGNTFTPGRTPHEGDQIDLLAEIAPDKGSGNESLSAIRPAYLALHTNRCAGQGNPNH
jgi:predicted TIM-barrel fold metal-dependent hydrolase